MNFGVNQPNLAEILSNWYLQLKRNFLDSNSPFKEGAKNFFDEYLNLFESEIVNVGTTPNIFI